MLVVMVYYKNISDTSSNGNGIRSWVRTFDKQNHMEVVTSQGILND